MGKQYTNSLFLEPRKVKSTNPIDDRFVVNKESDLYLRDTFKIDSIYCTYVGMSVTVVNTGEMYVLTKRPSSKNSTTDEKYAANIEWKKVGGSDISTSDYAAVIVESEDDLVDITVPRPYQGMLAVVKDNASTSEDEGALYVLIADDATDMDNWMKIGGSSTGSNAQITTDGTAPVSGSGFSIDPEDSDAYVEDEYVNYTDGKLLADTYYTGNGFGSFNGGYGNLEGVESVELTKGTSTIKFWASGAENSLDHWIKFDLHDESFGITYSDIIDEDGNAYTTGQFDVENGKAIKFLNVVDFNGANEQRYYNEEDSDSYTFGEEDSCTIGDLDIYISKVLPTVYAYAGDTSVRVLTEGDRVEIVNMIETIEPETITESDINVLFGDSSESEDE